MKIFFVGVTRVIFALNYTQGKEFGGLSMWRLMVLSVAMLTGVICAQDIHSLDNSKVSPPRKIIFIVDASGSMLSGEPGKTPWDLAVRELRNSIEKLVICHLFNVYFARVIPGPNEFYLRWKDAPVFANPPNKEDCLKFIQKYDAAMHDLGDRGNKRQAFSGAGMDLTQSMADALKSSPDVIFLLSDAEFDERKSREHNPVDEIRELNRLHGAHIYTISFIVKTCIPYMRRIAEENRGRFTFIPGAEGERK